MELQNPNLICSKIPYMVIKNNQFLKVYNLECSNVQLSTHAHLLFDNERFH